MKLISTLYSTKTLEFTLTIQNRNTKGNDEEFVDGPLIVRYKSRIGNESLIFNPSVAIMVRNRASKDGPKSFFITQPLFYRFVTTMTVVYQGLSTDKLYTLSNGVMYMDKKKATDVAIRMSLFRNALTVSPCIIEQGGSYVKGIEFSIDNDPIGSIGHMEALGVLETLKHFDIATYTLLAGVVDELEALDDRLKSMDLKLDSIVKLLQQQQNKGPNLGLPQQDSMLSWEPVSDKPYF